MLAWKDEDDQNQVHIPSYAEGFHILVIDEDTSYLNAVAAILEEASYIVTKIQCPKAALSMIEERPGEYDLVLFNTLLHDVDCITFLKKILQIKDNMPIVLMSFEPDDNLTKEARENGAAFVLDRPIRKSDFWNVWQHVISKRSEAFRKEERRIAAETQQKKKNAFLLANYDEKQIRIGKKHNQFLMHDAITAAGGHNNNLKGEEIKLEYVIQNRKVSGAERKRTGQDYGGTSNQAKWNKKQIRTWAAELERELLGDSMSPGYLSGFGAPTTRQQAMHEPNWRQGQFATHLQVEPNMPILRPSLMSSYDQLAQQGRSTNPLNLQSRVMQKRNPYNSSTQKNGNFILPNQTTNRFGFGTAPQPQTAQQLVQPHQPQIAVLEQQFIDSELQPFLNSRESTRMNPFPENFPTNTSTVGEKLVLNDVQVQAPTNVDLDKKGMSKMEVPQEGVEELYIPDDMFEAVFSDVDTSLPKLDVSFTFEELFPELENGDADGNASSSNGGGSFV